MASNIHKDLTGGEKTQVGMGSTTPPGRLIAGVFGSKFEF